MEKLKVVVKGIAPLVLHNGRTVNPLNPYSKALKEVTAKRKKTDSDFELLSRIEWEAGFYVSPLGRVCMPAINLEAGLVDAAKKRKLGKAIKAGVRVEESYVLLSFPDEQVKLPPQPSMEEIPHPDFEPLFLPKYVDCRIVKVGQARIIRSRPIFTEWGMTFTILSDENVINKRDLSPILADFAAGGMCEMRPRYGTFDISIGR